MAKPIFTNIDFNGNSAMNFVIGSRSSDPMTGYSDGYVYYNNMDKCLRLYSNGSWNSLVDDFRIVESLPTSGTENVVYLLTVTVPDSSYNTYSAYIWKNNTYRQISGYKLSVSWNDILDKPDLLQCNLVNIQDSSDYSLHLYYD